MERRGGGWRDSEGGDEALPQNWGWGPREGANSRMTPRCGLSTRRNGIIKVTPPRKGWSQVRPFPRVTFLGSFNVPVDCLIFSTLRGGKRIPETVSHSLETAQLAINGCLHLGFPENGAWDKDMGAGGLFGQQLRPRNRCEDWGE